jgi:hypothetical protein
MNNIQTAELITRKKWDDITQEEKSLVYHLIEGTVIDRDGMRNMTRPEVEEILDQVQPKRKSFAEAKTLREWIG